MKRMLALLLSALLLLPLTACGDGTGKKPVENAGEEQRQPESVGQEREEKPQQQQPAQDAATSKTMAYFMKYAKDGSYTMEYQSEVEGMSLAVLAAYDRGRVYAENTADGVKSIMLMLEDGQYMLDPATKTAMKSNLLGGSVQQVFDEAADAYETPAATGTMDIGGVSYEYEEFDVEGSLARYCFDGEEVKYIVSQAEGMEVTMEILRMEKGADPALFELPADYTVTEF